MNQVQNAALVLRHLGLRWVMFRVRYAVRRRAGGLRRRSPVGEWPSTGGRAESRVRLFASPPKTIGVTSVIEADAVLVGRFKLFSCHEAQAGIPPVWNRNPLTGETAPRDRHWSELGDFSFGDIKGIWELNRFPWAFALGRAWARTQDPRYAEGFWILFEDWMNRNPPNAGPAWMCGQEATFRLMAATFARWVCASAPATTSQRVSRFEQLVIATGRRISRNLDYALSQSNNHGVSECVGLITAATLLGNAGEAREWKEHGLRELEQQLATLVYADGAFSQHSAVYHRVLLHDLVWMTALLRATNESIPGWVLDAGRRALVFLEALTDPATGLVPLYGANDGSNILPLADCEYLDFRPVVQAARAVFFGERAFPEGPWDEAAGWLAGDRWSEVQRGGGADARKAGASASRTPVSSAPRLLRPSGLEGSQHFPEGGVFLWRRGATQLFLRCPTSFRHRPSQADLLHVSLTWGGQPIAIDPGTYSYNGDGRFAGALKEAAVHNSVTFDGQEPMTKVGRFLYLPWPRGSTSEVGEGFEAEHDGWNPIGVRHVRRIYSVRDDRFRVEDRLTSPRPRTARLHWLLADFPFEHDASGSALRLETPRGAFRIEWTVPPGARVSIVRADPGSARGWWSAHYREARPALSLVIEFEFKAQVIVATMFGPA